jgi:hypothetical protein
LPTQKQWRAPVARKRELMSCIEGTDFACSDYHPSTRQLSQHHNRRKLYPFWSFDYLLPLRVRLTEVFGFAVLGLRSPTHELRLSGNLVISHSSELNNAEPIAEGICQERDLLPA